MKIHFDGHQLRRPLRRGLPYRWRRWFRRANMVNKYYLGSIFHSKYWIFRILFVFHKFDPRYWQGCISATCICLHSTNFLRYQVGPIVGYTDPSSTNMAAWRAAMTKEVAIIEDEWMWRRDDFYIAAEPQHPSVPLLDWHYLHTFPVGPISACWQCVFSSKQHK